ncbi:MAG: divergent PAP2 family protein [Oscillospiraceae bacterium]
MSLIISNYLINVAFISWLSAQILKTIFVFLDTKSFVPERLIGAGGMPSSHSALVTSLAIAAAKKVGFSSPEFAITLALAAIVMYDAMGVRRAAGEQAKVLNKIMSVFDENSFNAEIEEFSLTEKRDDESRNSTTGDKKLKEYLGHTPLEVLGGALLGILVATMMPVI